MTGPGDYTVDPDELIAIVRELKTCRTNLERNLTDLRRQMKVLQDSWEGLSADAQAVAQEEWEQGMETMNFALQDLTDASEYAHGNYTGAIQLNMTMWDEVL